MAAVARLGDLRVAPMYLRGFPSPGSVGKNAPGEERLRRRRRFARPFRREIWTPRRKMQAMATQNKGRLGSLLLGLGFGFGWLGEVTTPKGVA